MKNSSKIISLVLALCMICAMSVTAFAADVETSGGSGSTPVNLSSTSDGTIDGAPAATAMSVTVPTAFPMAMAQNGDVTCATDCKIINNSYGAVRVKSVTINAANGWKLTAFGDKSTLAGEKVDSNKFGFALNLGNFTRLKTKGAPADTQTLLAAPTHGCYMTGVGNPFCNTISVTYNAIVTPLSAPVTNTNIANVVFVIEWDTAD